MMATQESTEPFDEWSTLPEPIWLNIFSKCRAMDVLSIKRVCYDWCRIVSDFKVISHLHLKSEDNPKITFDSLIELLIFASTHLSCLWIDGRISIMDSTGKSIGRRSHKQLMITLSNRCQRLRRLCLENFEVTNLSYESLPFNLSHLSLINCSDLSLQMFEVFNSFHTSVKFISIIYLNLSRVSHFDSLFCQSINRFTSLRYIYLEQLTRVNDGGIAHISPQITANLVVIDLEGTDIKDESFQMILNNGHSLKSLYLGRTQISGNFDINESMAKQTLKNLCLINTGINFANFEKILTNHSFLQSVNCDPTIKDLIDLPIITSNESISDTCLHYLTDDEFTRSD